MGTTEQLSASQQRELQKGFRLRAASPTGAVTIDQRHPGEYRVRSENGNGSYKVILMNGVWTCDCPSYLELQAPCKHVWAVWIGQDPKEARSQAVGPRPTYTQDWPAYNAAQQAEHRLFDPLLWSLLGDMEEPVRRAGKRGRNPIPMRTQILMAVKKVHFGLSCARARGLIEVASGDGNGIMGRVPNYAVPSRVFNMGGIEDVFVDLIQRSALPLKDLEDGGTVAIDSSGFCTTCRGSYCTETHNPGRKHRFLKAHVVVGVKTHIILNVTVTDESGADHPQFVPLLEGMKGAGFNPAIVVADRAYPSRTNYQAAADLGMEAYLPFKSNSTGSTVGVARRGSVIYRKMLLMFQLHREEFDKVYHARSNVEAVFSAIKRKLGEELRSKNPEARICELLAKLLAYNLTVLVHEIYEHGIDPESVGLPPPSPRPPPEPEPDPEPTVEPETVPRPDLLTRAIYRVQPAPRDSIPSAVTEFGKVNREP